MYVKSPSFSHDVYLIFSSTSFESLDRFPPERHVTEEFDQRKSFRLSLFDPPPEPPAPPPPRESRGPFIPRPDYEEIVM